MVVFVLPFFMEQTLRFVRGAARLPGSRLAVVSQDPLERLPADLAGSVAAHWRVRDVFDLDQLHAAMAGLAARHGPIDCIMGTLEQLQVPLAKLRASLGLAGMSIETARNFRDKSRMKDVLREATLPCARHALVARGADARRFAAEVGYPLVIKPPAPSARFVSTARWTSNATWRRMHPMPPPPRSPKNSSQGTSIPSIASTFAVAASGIRFPTTCPRPSS